jgi:hypothetical protein
VIYAVFHCSRNPKVWRQRLTSTSEEGAPSE